MKRRTRLVAQQRKTSRVVTVRIRQNFAHISLSNNEINNIMESAFTIFSHSLKPIRKLIFSLLPDYSTSSEKKKTRTHTLYVK